MSDTHALSDRPKPRIAFESPAEEGGPGGMSQVHPHEDPLEMSPRNDDGGGGGDAPPASPKARSSSAASSEQRPLQTPLHDANWFVTTENFPPPRRRLGLFGDLRYGIFGDMTHNSHRNRLLGMLMFAFCVAFVLLWLVAIEFFSDAEGSFALRFERDVPAHAMIGVPMAEFSLVVLDRNSLFPVQDATVSVYAFPAESFSLSAKFQTVMGRGEVDETTVGTREVNCLKSMFEPQGTYAYQDTSLCNTPLSGNVVQTDDKGRATFSNLRVLGGPEATQSLVIRAEVPRTWSGEVDQVFVERFVLMMSPVKSLVVAGDAVREIEPGLNYTVVGDLMLELTDVTNTSVAEASLEGVSAAVFGVEITGRDMFESVLMPLEGVDEFRHVRFTTRNTSIALRDVRIVDGGALVQANLTLDFTVDWFVGSNFYPAMYVLGELVFIGPRIGSPLQRPHLYRPVRAVPPDPPLDVTCLTPLPDILKEGHRSAVSVRFAFESSTGLTDMGLKGAVLARVVSFNGSSLPAFYEDADPGAMHTTLKTTVRAVAEADLDPMLGKMVAHLNVSFTTAGLCGRYGVQFFTEDRTLQIILDDGNSTPSDIWYVDVTSSVTSVTGSFLETLGFFRGPGQDLSFPVTVGTPLSSTPALSVRDATSRGIAGKVGRWVAANPAELGLNAVSLESDGRGFLQFARTQVTFASREGLHTTLMYVDDVLALRVEFNVSYNHTATDLSAPSHVELLDLPAGSLLNFRSSVRVRLLNAIGQTVPAAGVWVTLHKNEKRTPPIGFASKNGLEWTTSSPVATSDANGVAVIPIAYTGFPSPVAMSFAFQGMDAASTFPPNVGGLFMEWGGAGSRITRKLPPTAITHRELPDGTVLVEGRNPVVPVVLVVVQYPLRLTNVMRLDPPYSDTSRTPSLTIPGKDAPGDYVVAVYGAGKWGGEVYGINITSPVRRLEIVTPTAVAGEDLDDDGFPDPDTITENVPDGTPFAQQPLIRVLDGEGRPVPDVVVSAVLNNPGAVSAMNPLYRPEAMVTEGVLAGLDLPDVSSPEAARASIDKITKDITIAGQFPGLSLSGSLSGAAEDPSSAMSRVYDAATAGAISRLSSLPVRYAVSQPSDADGICEFDLLTVLNPPAGRPFQITYVYTHTKEVRKQPAVFVTEQKRRQTNVTYRGIVLTPPPAVASAEQPFSQPVTVGLIDADYNMLPITMGSVEARAYSTSLALKAELSVDASTLLKGAGPLVVPSIAFGFGSDYGLYQLRFALPGTELFTTGVSYSGDPHTLEVIEEPPTRILVGSSFRVKVAARLGDGSGVPQVRVRARFEPVESTSTSSIESRPAEYTALTASNGVATFYIPHGAGRNDMYRIKFTANRGVSSFFDASTSLTDTANAIAGVDIADEAVSRGLDRVPAEYKGYLEKRVVSSAATIAEYSFQQVVQAFREISVESLDVEIFNGVRNVSILQEPVLDVPGTSPLSLGPEGVFTTVPIVQVIGMNGEPLAGRTVTVEIFGIVPGAILTWNSTNTTDADGYYEFTGLQVLNVTGPQSFALVFFCEGEPSDPSATVVLEERRDVTRLGTVYWKAAFVFILILPWLFSNTPESSPVWSWLSFVLSAAMPWIITLVIPGLLDNRNSFVQTSVYFTIALWAVITLGLFIMIIDNLLSGKNVGQAAKLRNDYRYVRWLSTMIPFAAEAEILEYREHCAVKELSVGKYICYKLYLGYLKLFHKGVRVSLVGERNQYSWRSVSRTQLCRPPTIYRMQSSALQYQYGLFFGRKEGFDNEVTCRVRGCDRWYCESRKIELHQQIAALMGVEIWDLRVYKDGSYGQTAELVFLINETPLNKERIDAAKKKYSTERLEDALEAALIGRELFPQRLDVAKKCLPITVDKLNVVTSADRRVNDEAWTWRDSMKVRLHFACVPVVLERERRVERPGGMAESEEESDSDEDGAFHGRVWVRHSMPEGFLRSNGQPFPDFWSPSHDENCTLTLIENDARNFNSPPLDHVKEEHGGKPKDIVEPIYYPFRFLVAVAVCFVLLVFITLFTLYIYRHLVRYLELIKAYVPEPNTDMTDTEKAEFNASVQRYLRYTLEAIASMDARFEFVRELIPRIEDVDYVAAWQWVYDVSGEFIYAMTIAAFIALVCAVIVSFVHWGFMLTATPVYVKEIRRGESREPNLKTKAECYVADRYVGTQAFHVAVSFMLVYSIVFLIGVLIFQPRLLPWFLRTYWPEIMVMVLTAIAGVFVELIIIRFFVAPKHTVKHPRVYSKWQLAALVIHTVGGLVITLVRWAKSVAFQTLLFARLDLMLFPGVFNMLDQGYWSFWSMLYVDESHNNPILRVFVATLLTDHYLTMSNEGVVTDESRDEEERSPRAGVNHKEDVERPTILLRFVPTQLRCDDETLTEDEIKEAGQSLGRLSCIENMKVYIDSEVVSERGRPLRRVIAAETEGGLRPDLRFFRSPLPALGPVKFGDGCHLCGTSEMTEFFAPDMRDVVGAKYLRVVYPIITPGEDSDDDETVEWIDWRGQVDPVHSTPAGVAAGGGHAQVKPLNSCELNGAWVTELEAEAVVSAYTFTPFAQTAAAAQCAQTTQSSVMERKESEKGLLEALVHHGKKRKKKKHTVSQPATVVGQPTFGGLAPGDPNASTPTPATWLLLGSNDGVLWGVVDEGSLSPQKQAEGAAAVHTTRERPRMRAVCVTCYGKRQREEGAPRVLVGLDAEPKQLPSVGVGHTESLYFEVTLPGDVPIRGYSVQTSESADPETDAVSWVFAAARTSYDEHMENPTAVPWVVYHDMVRSELPKVRGMYTPVFGCWPTPATRLDFRKTFLADHADSALPHMRQVVRVRYRHILGVEGTDLATGEDDASEALLSARVQLMLQTMRKEEAKEKEKERKASKEKAPHAKPSDEVVVYDRTKHGRWGRNLNGMYSSLLERSAYRNMRCRKHTWWVVFMLTMNPSLLGTRKSVRREMRLTYDQLRINAKYLRDRIDIMKWRVGERQGVLALAPGKSERQLGRMPSEKVLAEAPRVPPARHGRGVLRNYTVSCMSPSLSGVYEEAEAVRVRIVPAAPDKRARIVGEQITAVISAQLGVADVTSEVRALLKDGDLDFPFAAAGGLDITPHVGQSFDVRTDKATAEQLTVTYACATWGREQATPHPIRGVRTEMVAMVSGSLLYQNGSWRVGCRVPAPGYQYSFLVSEPVATTTMPDAGLVWHWWDATLGIWKVDPTVKIQAR